MKLIRSARRTAKRNMHQARQVGAGTEAPRPPWPSAARRAIRRGLDAIGSPAGLLLSACALTAFMIWATYWAHPSTGRKLANNGFLMTLWQVQAAAVSLALALAVFVFGLFPRSGNRVSYRTFLRRSSARPVIAWGIASLLLDGIVLLGFGHQEPNTPGSSDGHGWAVTVASAVGLASIASIALLFGRTIGAIDPVAGASALTDDRHTVIGEALRSDLLAEFAYGVMEQCVERFHYEFIPGYYRSGRRVSSTPSGGVVHNISLRRLNAIGKHALEHGRSLPQIHVWPGQRLVAAVPLVTIDPATPLRDRLRARRCVRLRQVKRDEATELLDALYSDVLEYIRADRPVDALAGMTAMTEMLQLAWQADQAHPRATTTMSLSRLAVFSTRGFKDQVTSRLNSVVRAGAVSSDEQIRNHTAQYPRQLAASALHAHAAESVRACLALYPRLYEAVISDVTDAGRLPIPSAGVGRQRITRIFNAVLSFPSADVLMSLDQARRTLPNQEGSPWASFELDAAVFAVEQACTANTVILAMLRQALAFGDVLTIERVVPKWEPPHADWLQHELQAPTAGDAGEAVFAGLEQALNEQREALTGMKLRLLRSALQLEAQETLGASTEGEPGLKAPTDPDPAVAAVLDSLEPGTFWSGITAAASQVNQDIFPVAQDDEVRPDGWHMSGFAVEGPGLADTCVRAALARPQLTTVGDPDPDYARANATQFIEAARKLADHVTWAQLYGTPANAQTLSDDLITRMQRAGAVARRREAERAVAVPLPDPELLRKLIAQQYAAQEILTRLFAWAGRPLLIEVPFTSTPLSVVQFYDRSELTVTDEGRLKHTVDTLAAGLTLASIGLLAAEVATQTTVRTVAPEHVSDRVVLAIAALRRYRTLKLGKDAAAPGIVVLVPADKSGLADLLDVRDRARDRHPSAPGASPSAREQMLAQLGFDNPQLEWHLLGTIQGVPVVRINSLEAVFVVDLAHGVECRANASLEAQESQLSAVRLTPESEQSARERFTPVQPGETSESESEAALNAIEEQITRLMTQVEVTMDLAMSLTVSPAAGVRVLAIADA